MNHNPLSPASATNHRHILVVLEHHFVLIVKIEHGNRVQLSWNTAHLWCHFGFQCVNERLHHSMVSRVHVISMRIMALALAVVRFVARWSDNPVCPADICEVHVQRFSLAQLSSHLVLDATPWSSTSFSTGYRILDWSLLVPLVIRVREEKRLVFRPFGIRLVGAATQSDVSLFDWFVVFLRCDVYEKSMVLFGFANPSIDGWLNIEF